MGYRDDEEALRRRVADLEGELSEAHATIARLQGESATHAGASDKPNWFLGAPMRLELERELPFEVTDEGYEAIAELARKRFPTSMGGVSQVGRTLTYQQGGVTELKLSRIGPGRTRMSLRSDHRAHGVILGAMAPGASLFALVGVVAVLRAVGATPASLVVALPLVVISCFLLIRALVARSVVTQRAKMAGLFETVAEIAAQHTVPRVRIDEIAPAVENEPEEGAVEGVPVRTTSA
jgi:hypothetical protein